MRGQFVMDARWSGMTGQVTERIAGGLTALFGSGMVLWLAFGPWTCPSGGAACYGLLGPSARDVAELPSIIFVWLPLICAALLGVGALLNATGRPAALAGWRWATALGIGLPTLLLLVTAPVGVLLIPVFLLAYLTAGIGELRAQRGQAPDSVAAPVFGGLATVAVVAVAFLAVQWLYLLLRA